MPLLAKNEGALSNDQSTYFRRRCNDPSVVIEIVCTDERSYLQEKENKVQGCVSNRMSFKLTDLYRMS